MRTLESVLEERSLASAAQVSEAVARSALHGGDLTTSLLQFTSMDEAQLTAALADYYGLPPVWPGALLRPQVAAPSLVPQEVAERHCCFPLERSAERLVLAVARPLPLELARELSEQLGVALEERVAVEVRIRQAIARDYGLPLAPRHQRGIARLDGMPEQSPDETPSAVWGVPRLSALPRPPSGPPVSVLPAHNSPAHGSPAHGSAAHNGSHAGPPVAHDATTAAQSVRPARRRGPYTLELAEEDLKETTERDAVLSAFFNFACQYFEYTALFAVHSALAEGLDARGPGADRDQVQGIGVPLDLPSSLATAGKSCQPNLITLGGAGLDASLALDLARKAEGKILLLPVCVRGRCALLLYGDNGESDVVLSEIKDLLALTPHVSKALERVILLRKRQAAARKSLPVTPSLKPGLASTFGTVPPASTGLAKAVPRAALPHAALPHAALPHAALWTPAADLPPVAADAPTPAVAEVRALRTPDAREPAIVSQRVVSVGNMAGVKPPSIPAADDPIFLLARPMPRRAAVADPTPPAEGESAQPVVEALQHPAIEALEPEPAIVEAPVPVAVEAPVHSAVSEPEPAPPAEESLGAASAGGDSPGAGSPGEAELAAAAVSAPVAAIIAVSAAGASAELASVAETPAAPAATEGTSAGDTPANNTGAETAAAAETPLAPDAAGPRRRATPPALPNAAPAPTAPAPAPGRRPLAPLRAIAKPPVAISVPGRLRTIQRLPSVIIDERHDLPQAPAARAANNSAPASAPAAPTPAAAPAPAVAPAPAAAPAAAAAPAPAAAPVPAPPASPTEDLNKLVERLCAGELDAVPELERAGNSALPYLMKRFPGPVISDRSGPSSRASECGPLLAVLAKIGTPALGYVVRSSESSDPNVRRWATLLLGEMPSADASKAVVQRLADDTPLVHLAALDAARLLLAGPAQSQFRRALFETAEEKRAPLMLRLRSIEHAAKLKDGASVPRLIALLNTGVEPIIHKALWALTMVTRQDHGRDIQAWSDWWHAQRSRHRVQWLIDALDHEDVRQRRAALDELAAEVKEDFGYNPDLERPGRQEIQTRYREWWSAVGARRYGRMY